MKAPSLSQLRAAVLPFVTRSLRGNRLRRYTLLSMMLAALTVMVGTWITLSPGSFERELRHEFGMEDARYERERQEFTIFADDDEEFAALTRARANVSTPGWNEYDYRASPPSATTSRHSAISAFGAAPTAPCRQSRRSG